MRDIKGLFNPEPCLCSQIPNGDEVIGTNSITQYTLKITQTLGLERWLSCKSTGHSSKGPDFHFNMTMAAHNHQ